MAQVDSKIDLVWLGDINLSVLSLLHEDCNKLIADLRSMFGVVCQAEMLSLLALLPLRLLFNLDIFRLELFSPPEFIEALTEEHSVSEYNLVEVFIDFLRDTIEIEGEDLIDMHCKSISISKVFVVPSMADLSALIFVAFYRERVRLQIVLSLFLSRELGKVLEEGVLLIRLVKMVLL